LIPQLQEPEVGDREAIAEGCRDFQSGGFVGLTIPT
jgi:hypothetical protein